MIVKKAGVVEAVLVDRDGAQELLVRIGPEQHAAINYTNLSGRAEVGDRVIVNTTARVMNLGTGGYDFVIHNDALETPEPADGHLMKLRYTPLQFACAAAEETDAERIPDSLTGAPVIACGLHSQVAPVAFAIRASLETARIAYIMTDSAALALGFSHSVAELLRHKMIDGVVTVGQAFGGDLEAVNVYSGLLVARGLLQADAIIVSQGPGNTGTGSTWGFSAIDQGVVLNAACSLGGDPVCCLRMSFADLRERHTGISHHCTTVLTRVALCDCTVAMPHLTDEPGRVIARQLEAVLAQRCGITVEYADTEETMAAFARSGLSAITMGRSPDDDPAFFASAVAAGIVAAKHLQT